MPAQNQESANNYPDLITHLLAYLLSLTPSIHMNLEDIAVISRQISLVLVGVIILSSMRLVLRGVTRVTICRYPVWERRWLVFFSELGPARNKSESWSVFDVANPRTTDGEYTDATRSPTICSNNKMPMTLVGNISFVYNCTASHVISSASDKARPRPRRDQSLQHYPRIPAFWVAVWHIILGGCGSQCFWAMGRRKG